MAPTRNLTRTPTALPEQPRLQALRPRLSGRSLQNCPDAFTSHVSPRSTSSTRIFQVIYALIAIFGSSLTVIRLQAGDWIAALWPALIAAFCIYRLFTVTEPE